MSADMIGVFDSGVGGLTILRALVARFPDISFVYLGDHANVPIGEKHREAIVTLTRQGVVNLFNEGCRLVIIGCNTATAIAARELQRKWLPHSGYKGRNLLGIVAPTVEAATQTLWAVTSPQYPQKYNSDKIVVFGTPLTVNSSVYVEEISKRCPMVHVVQQACPGLAGAIENGASEAMLQRLVAHVCKDALSSCAAVPDHAILGCTHYPIIEHLFRANLPAHTRIFSQPTVVADSLDDYLKRHSHYVLPLAGPRDGKSPRLRFLTTGNPDMATAASNRFWKGAAQFEALG